MTVTENGLPTEPANTQRRLRRMNWQPFYPATANRRRPASIVAKRDSAGHARFNTRRVSGRPVGAPIEMRERDHDGWYAADIQPIAKIAECGYFAIEIVDDAGGTIFCETQQRICALLSTIGRLPACGDHVVCRRRNRFGKIEAAVKQLKMFAGATWLCNVKDDPAYADPIKLCGLRFRRVSALDMLSSMIGIDASTGIEIIAIVVGTYRPE